MIKTRVFRFDDLVIETGKPDYITMNPGHRKRGGDITSEDTDLDEVFGYICPYIINGKFYDDRRSISRREYLAGTFSYEKDSPEKIEAKLHSIAERLTKKEPGIPPDFYDWQTFEE